MKIYYLDGESVPIDTLREIAANLSEKETFYYTDEDIINILNSHGMQVKVNSVDGSLFSSLPWTRP